MSRIKDILSAYSVGSQSYSEVAQRANLDIDQIRVYTSMLRKRGDVERENPGQYPAVHRVTLAGGSKLYRRVNSVFALGEMNHGHAA